MSWSERQQGMLRAMGLRLWSPPAAPGVTPHSPRVPPAQLAAAPQAGLAVPPPPAPLVPALGRAQVARAASGVGQMDWPALREAVASCRACTLCDSRKQTVFGVGHPQAHWLVVGEAP
ncbi:MAG: uracil-DNA glycosylase, partial [Rubrivivax sp.]|nr:uracil-DNA glycosylase [Rubrivivax sp.]